MDYPCPLRARVPYLSLYAIELSLQNPLFIKSVRVFFCFSLFNSSLRLAESRWRPDFSMSAPRILWIRRIQTVWHARRLITLTILSAIIASFFIRRPLALANCQHLKRALPKNTPYFTEHSKCRAFSRYLYANNLDCATQSPLRILEM
jgi:hypothetical protein